MDYTQLLENVAKHAYVDISIDGLPVPFQAAIKATANLLAERYFSVLDVEGHMRANTNKLAELKEQRKWKDITDVAFIEAAEQVIVALHPLDQKGLAELLYYELRMIAKHDKDFKVKTEFTEGLCILLQRDLDKETANPETQAVLNAFATVGIEARPELYDRLPRSVKIDPTGLVFLGADGAEIYNVGTIYNYAGAPAYNRMVPKTEASSDVRGAFQAMAAGQCEYGGKLHVLTRPLVCWDGMSEPIVYPAGSIGLDGMYARPHERNKLVVLNVLLRSHVP